MATTLIWQVHLHYVAPFPGLPKFSEPGEFWFAGPLLRDFLAEELKLAAKTEPIVRSLIFREQVERMAEHVRTYPELEFSLEKRVQQGSASAGAAWYHMGEGSPQIGSILFHKQPLILVIQGRLAKELGVG